MQSCSVYTFVYFLESFDDLQDHTGQHPPRDLFKHKQASSKKAGAHHSLKPHTGDVRASSSSTSSSSSSSSKEKKRATVALDSYDTSIAIASTYDSTGSSVDTFDTDDDEDRRSMKSGK